MTADAPAADTLPFPPVETDVVVVGGGPAGLFAVFQLGLLGLRCAVVDALPHLGGQVVELYADKPIYDIPALPMCTGAELIERLATQIRPFAPALHLGQTVTSLDRVGGPDTQACFELGTDAGLRLRAPGVILASGVGAFTPRRLPLAGLEALERRQVFHLQLPPGRTDPGHLVIVGGDDAALDQAIAWASPDTGPAPRPTPHSVTLLHRRAVYTASPERVDRVHALARQGWLQLRAGQPLGLRLHDPASAADGAPARLQALDVALADGSDTLLATDTLLVCLGLHPKLGAIADWGLALQRKQLVVDPTTGATSVPGIHAVGDSVTYPDKKKLIVCGFHEATMAAHALARRLRPQDPDTLLYTSSSALLQGRLGAIHGG